MNKRDDIKTLSKTWQILINEITTNLTITRRKIGKTSLQKLEKQVFKSQATNTEFTKMKHQRHGTGIHQTIQPTQNTNLK